MTDGSPMTARPQSRHALALLLVDVNRSFFDPSGSFYYPAAQAALGPIGRLLETARGGGRLVVHALEQHRPTVNDHEWLRLPAHCIRSGFDAEPFPGFEPRPDEIVVGKRRYSAFFATDLALALSEQAVRRLVVVGVKTNVCIRATVQDAFGYGLRPTVVREAVNSNRPHLHDASLEDIERYMGDVIDLAVALDWFAGDGPDD
jgi:maleamate amidohydrolase